QLTGLGSWYHYYAGLADKLEGRQIPAPSPDYLVYTRREPVGVVAAITPWNSPLMLLTWKLAPALAAGCTMVVKPSEHAPVSTMVFAELFEQAGFPPGVVNVVTGLSRDTGAALAGHPGVDKVAFTGSTATGRAAAIRLGDPNDPATEMGPVANEPQYRKVLEYLRTAREQGATAACGGGPDSGLGGYFIRPAVLTGVGPRSTVVREEIFGPVLSAYPFTDEDEALKLANDTPYGLAGAVWT